MRKLRINLSLLLFGMLTFSVMGMAKQPIQAPVAIQFETISSPKCRNGFSEPQQVIGKITEQLKKQVQFNAKKNWMHTFQYCTFATFNDQQYVIRNYFILDSKSALYMIFDNQNAYAIYGDYSTDGKWFYRHGKTGEQTENLRLILEKFLVEEEWLERK